MPENPGKDWQELCAAAAEERDAEKLILIVHQLLQILEGRTPATLLADRPDRLCGQP